MTVSLSPIGGAASQFFNSGGVPLYGGKIYTYEAGTTTPKATYTQANGLTAHPNPIILNSAGRVPGGEIWLTSAQAYLFILKNSSDETIGTYDNIYGINAGGANAVTETQVATAGQTDFVLTSMAYTPGVFTLGVYIDGVNQVVNNSYVETSATTVTFVSGLHVGALVKFININSAATDSNVVSYLPAGAGAVATTVQAKLRESVSVKDFGAVGDGVADDTAAVQAAVSAHNDVFFPEGSYRITTAIAVPAATRLFGSGRVSQIHAYGVHGFTLAAAQDGVTIESLAMFSYAAGGAPDPKALDAIRANGAYGNTVSYVVCRDLYLQGWANCVNGRYLWNSRFENVSTINSNYGVTLFGQSVNNAISNSSLVVNSGNASVYLPPDGSTIGEGLTITNSLLSSGAYGIQSGTGFLSLHVSNCIIDLVTDVGLKLTDVRSLHCVGNWIYAANKGIEYAPLGSAENVNGAISSNTIEVTSASGRGVDIGALNRGVNVIGGAVKVSGTAQGVYVDGTNCFVGGVHFINPGSGASVYLNVTTGNKIGACTGTVTTIGGFQNDYSTGGWTPVDVSGAGLSVAVTGGTTPTYIKIGSLVVCSADVTYPATADASNAKLSLPFTPSSTNPAGHGIVGFKSDGVFMVSAVSSTGASFFSPVNTFLTNANLSGVRFQMTWTFYV